MIQKLKVKFHESPKDRDALIEAGRQLSDLDATDVQRNVHRICQQYVTIQSADFIIKFSVNSVFSVFFSPQYIS